MSTAVAVLEINSPSRAVIAKRLARTTRGPAPPKAAIRASAARPTPPVRCRARENGSMPTIRTRLAQWIKR
jgi:hypothetical protein